MGDIIYFFRKYTAFIFFILLEVISLYLVSQYNTKQKEIYNSSANFFSGIIFEKVTNVTNFLYMSNIADSLATENARLRQEIENAKYVLSTETGSVSFPLDTSIIRKDTVSHGIRKVTQHFNYIASEVINNTVNSPENYITLNKGSLVGVEKGMGVISQKGVVGVVTNVTPHFSQVMSILNRDMKISAMIKRNRYFGTLKWDTKNPFYLWLDEVPKYTQAQVGDTIITSGYSDIFPGNIRIGKVDIADPNQGNNFLSLRVRLYENMVNIKYVYVVKNVYLNEMELLKQNLK
jgi:rod shape-determining protein MreC